MLSYSLIVRGDVKDLANKISSLIFDHQNDIQGKYSSSPNLDYSKIERKENGEFVVSYWSDGGVFHDCWIDAIIKRIDDSHCLVTFNGCEETIKLAKIVAKYLEL